MLHRRGLAAWRGSDPVKTQADSIGSAPVNFAVVGAGWRTEFFLRIAAAIPEMSLCGIAARNDTRRAAIEAEWRVPCFATIDEMLDSTRPAFVVASVSAPAIPEVCVRLARRAVPILAETPPATTRDGLVELYETLARLDARIQIAEQFWAQPLHAARQTVADSGVLGTVNQVHLSVCHDYHAMSLIRRLLGVGYAEATIRGTRYSASVLAGPDRSGPPTGERLVEAQTDYAWLDFGGGLGLYEFCLPQYRSWIRGQRVCIRGERGEIIDETVTWLRDALTPVTARLVRHEAGRNGNHEGHHLKGIQFLDSWIWKNPVSPARLNDEEIAVAQCLLAMHRYVETGESFYSLAEASQDQYLALSCQEAIRRGTTVRTAAQVWQPSR